MEGMYDMDRRENKRFTRLAALILALMLVPVFAVFGFAAETEEPDEQVCYVHGNLTGEVTVDAQDAIYLLYHYANPEEFPLNQNGDFDGDEAVTAQDAIWLLYASLGILEDHELLGEVHAYTTDTWEWSEDGREATVTLACACSGSDAIVETVEVTSASTGNCTVAGLKTYSATYTHDGVVYTAQKSETLDAPGHQWRDGKAPTCEEGAVCDTCGFEQKPLGHIYNVEETAATCMADGYETYSCMNCDLEPFTVVMEGTKQEHNWNDGELVVDGCSTKTVYTCRNDGCGATSETDEVVSHTYTAAITQDATCVATGVKTYTCSCGASETEEIETNQNHSWSEGVLGADGVTTTYTCSLCHETKVSVAAKQAEVAKEDLENTSVELTDATVKMDKKTLDGIEGEAALTIQVDAVDVETVDESLLAALPGEVANGMVYDFTMYAGEEQITEFDGLVTVSIPYTLQEGDDPDCIAVYYIKDDGSVDCNEGIYANGQVTFTTNHFSYYTVTRLSATERCAQYGHVENTVTEDPTCTTAGYTLTTCERCGEVTQQIIIPAKGHNYAETRVEPTCTDGGSITKDCADCDSLVTINLPAVGHKWETDAENTYAATCDKDGQDARVCTNEDCGATYIQKLEKTGHSHELDESKTVDVSCTTDGSETYICHCGDSYTVVTGKAHGHQYHEERNSWTWGEGHTTATLTLYCYHDKTHTKVIPATVTKAAEDCQGNVTYTATASYNNRNYVSSQLVDTGVTGHMPAEEFDMDLQNHFRLCVRCRQKLDVAPHVFTDPVVTKAATCADTGASVSVCTICEFEKLTVIPATGTHSYVNGVCSACGIKNDACDHNITMDTLRNATPAGICSGSEIYVASCACGKNTCAYINLKCNIVQESMRQVTTEDGERAFEFVFGCTKCDLSYGYINRHMLDKEACRRWAIFEYDFRMNGKTFAKTCEYGEVVEDHPVKSETTVDLGKLGLCGGELNVIECHCGMVGDQTDEMSTDPGCNWVLDRAKSTDDDNYLYYECSVCGAVKIVESEHSGNGCIYNLDKTLTYMVDGKIVYQDTFRPISQIFHSYKVVSTKLHGKNCEDGVTIVRTCAECGKTQEGYVRGHAYTEFKITDISKYGFCVTYLEERICPCGEASWSQIYTDEGGSCDMTWVGSDENGNTWRCVDCDMVYTETYTYGEKDESCMCNAVRTRTYYKGTGELAFAVQEKIRTENHNMKSKYELLGDSCEDGVKWTNYCTDCDYSTSFTDNDHSQFEISSIDLKKLGFCSGKVVYGACACGESAEVWTSQSDCVWGHNWLEDANGIQHHLMGCEVCGNSLDWSYSDTVTNGCNYKESVKVVALVDGVEKSTLSGFITGTNHRTVYTFHPYGDSCEDGYTVSGYCIECGYSYSTVSPEYSHDMYTVKLEKMTDKTCLPIYYQEVSCFCGLNQEVWTATYGENPCELNGDSIYLEDENRWVEVCEKCGIGSYTVTLDEQPTEDPCKLLKEQVRYFVNRSGETVDTYTQAGYEPNHNYAVSFEMLGDSCEDGYYVSWECRVCGDEDRNTTLQTDCSSWENGWTTLYDGEGICSAILQSSTVTPCGKEDTYLEFDCDFTEGIYDEDEKRWYYGCLKCGAERTNYTISEAPDTSEGAGPCDAIKRMQTVLRKNGQVITTYEFTTNGTNHDQIETYSFLNGGTSCEDGYTVTQQCSRCGESFGERGPYYDHNPDELWQGWDLSEYGLCGEENVSRWSCACGRYASGGWGGECAWEQVSEAYVDDAVMYKSYCANCNTYRYSLSDPWTTDAENCVATSTFYHRYERDGVELLTIEFEQKSIQHETVFDHFNLSGDTCEDGFTVTEKCKNCDFTQESGEMNEHVTYLVEEAELSEYGMCVGSYTRFRCACGKEGWENLDTNCDWIWVSTDENGVQTQQCAYCDTYRDYKYSEEKVYECTTNQITYQKLYNDQGVIKEVTSENKSIYGHNYVVESFNVHGEDCSGGYDAIHKCIYCGETNTLSQDAGLPNHNLTYKVDFIDLTEYGLCLSTQYHDMGWNSHPRKEVFRCACGEREMTSLVTHCDWSYQSTDASGMQTYICYTCGATREYLSITNEVGTCGRESVTTERIFKDGQKIAENTSSSTYEIHDDRLVSYDLYGDTCYDGYDVTVACEACGRTETLTEQNVCTTSYKMYNINLNEMDGLCGGNIDFRICLCGNIWEDFTMVNCIGLTSRTETQVDDNGITHTYEIQECSECDYKMVRESWYEPTEENCKYNFHVIYTFYNGEEILLSESGGCTETRHQNMTETWTLMEGATTCEDGVECIRSCADCGYSYNEPYYYHVTRTVETVDLTQYGAECATTLNHYSCVCGQEEEYRMEGADMCQFNIQGDYYAWVEGALATSHQSTSGNHLFRPYVEVWTCTDCGFQLRMGQYCLAGENCVAQEYKTWQYGYDPDAGTCLYEITEETDWEYQYHDYTGTSENSTLMDGTAVSTYTLTCNDCGSTVVTKDYWKNDCQVKYETISTNTLTNNFNRRLYNVLEYGQEHNGSYYQTLYRDETVDQYGNIIWYQHEYAYDFDACTRTHTYTTYEGTNDVTTDSHFNGSISNENQNVIDSTCTQYGSYQHSTSCNLCGEIVDTEHVWMEPNGHNWYPTDEGTHMCQTCGLVSDTADYQAIVLEDMTDYENGTEYVIGYWNRENLEFNVRASIAIDGVMNEYINDFEPTILTKENDWQNVVKFNVADLQGYAENTGYPLETSPIRIIFEVSQNGVLTEYAIDVDYFAN